MSLHSNGIIRILTEPERKVFESGNYLTTFYGGLSEGKDKDGNYIDNAIDVKIWGKTGDLITGENAFLGKGDSFHASGKVMQEKWTDRDSGTSRSKHVLEVGRIELLPRANDQAGAPARAPRAAAPAPAANNSSPFGGGFDEEEIPF
jgi:single-strand DNA-binding protein